MKTSKDQLGDDLLTQELLALCVGVLPIWARHLAASRMQSEAAINEMLRAFADIEPHIHLAERQSVQITEALSQSSEGVTGLALVCEHLLSPVLIAPELPDSTRLVLYQVLATVGKAVHALEEITKHFTHETQLVAAQVEQMYVGFQYQDRISQMMVLLEGDIARLQAVLVADTASSPALAAWLQYLESQYVMAEQRKDYPNRGNDVSASSESSEATYF
jgi:hypothetical protein